MAGRGTLPQTSETLEYDRRKQVLGARPCEESSAYGQNKLKTLPHFFSRKRTATLC